MKKILLTLLLVAAFSSCNQNKETTPDVEPVEATDDTDRMFTRDDVTREQDAVATEDDAPERIYEPADRDLEGTYQLADADTDDCRCNCLELNFSGETELCVVPDEVSIRVRYERAGDSRVNVFFVEPADRQQEGRPLPWQQFDKNTPIASLDLQPNRTFVLEWQGFATNGEVQTEHARLGKKHLEGTYVKQE